MHKVIVNFTPTGLIPRRTDNPQVPLLPSEIMRDVKEAYELGITMVHLHARECGSEAPTYKKESYGEIIHGIREFAPDLIICVSTSGRINSDYKSRSEVLSLEGNLKPDMASLTLGSVNFNKQASINEPDTIKALASNMRDKGIKPELEIFDLGMANYANYLLERDILEEPLYTNLILGNIACAQTDLIHIGCLIRDLPENTIIAMGGVGKAQFKANSLAISTGYGVRVGLEDNLCLDQGRTKLASNTDLLERIHRLASANERDIMKPSELRKILGLNPGYGLYGTGTKNGGFCQ